MTADLLPGPIDGGGEAEAPTALPSARDLSSAPKPESSSSDGDACTSSESSEPRGVEGDGGGGGGSSWGFFVCFDHAIVSWQKEYGGKDREWVGEEDGEKTTWTCPTCTFAENPIDFLVCNVCRLQKPGDRRL